MKKYKICRDKKIEKYLKIWFILTLIAILLASIISGLSIGSIYDESFDFLSFFLTFTFISIYEFVIYFVLNTQVANIIYLSDDELMSGWLFPKRMKLTEIKNILLNDHLIISSSYKSIKLIRHNSQENIKAYQEILSTLESNSYIDCEINTEVIGNDIIKGKPQIKQGKFTTIPILILIFVMGMLVSAAQLTFDAFRTDASLATIILYILFALYFFYVTIIYILKLKYAPKIISISFFTYTVMVFIKSFAHITHDPVFATIQIATYIVGFSSGIAFNMIIYRYFSISKTVKNIFIYPKEL